MDAGEEVTEDAVVETKEDGGIDADFSRPRPWFLVDLSSGSSTSIAVDSSSAVTTPVIGFVPSASSFLVVSSVMGASPSLTSVILDVCSASLEVACTVVAGAGGGRELALLGMDRWRVMRCVGSRVETVGSTGDSGLGSPWPAC
jgi:hypothetical protein